VTDARTWAAGAAGHCFTDGQLLDAALTHRSAGGAHNERLEFLGDAVLGLVIAEAVYHAHPDADEGDLSRLRAALVRKQTLAEIAGRIGIGPWIRLGQGEMKAGGHRRESILADATEALIGAVYLDAGYPAARETVLRLYEDRLRDLPSPEELKDPKTRLQEWLQGRARSLPEYRVLEVAGADHRQEFTVACVLPDSGEEARAVGRSRRKAEQAAARAMLEALSD
jgi:ribonuclease-3